MSDLEKLKALFTEFGIGFKMEAPQDHEVWRERHPGVVAILSCQDGANFYFTAEGKFIEMVTWE